MPSQALRWACRARTLAAPPLAGNPINIRALSTTRARLVENEGGGKTGAAGGVRARAVAAAMQINSLVKGRAELTSLRARDGNSNNSNSNRSSNSNSNSNFNKGNAPAAVGERPKVVDVKSIPRGLGRGVLRARAGPSSPAGTGTGNRFSPGNRFGPRGGNASARTGAGAGRKRTGGAGGKARARRGEERDKAAAAGPRGKRTDPFERLDAAEQAFDDAMRFGTRAAWAPSLTLESLSAFLPALPTAGGRAATVLQGLSALGTADPVGVGLGLQARSYAGDVEARGVRFFADVGAREAAERYLQEKRREQDEKDGKDGKDAEGSGPVIKDAEEAVRTAILERAVKGRFEEPRFVEAGDAVGRARAWHLRGGTWTMRDTVKFEQKIVPLLERYGAGAGARASR